MISVSETNIKNPGKTHHRYVLDTAYPTRINVYLYSTRYDLYHVYQADLEQNINNPGETKIVNDPTFGINQVSDDSSYCRYVLDPADPTHINVYLYSNHSDIYRVYQAELEQI